MPGAPPLLLPPPAAGLCCRAGVALTALSVHRSSARGAVRLGGGPSEKPGPACRARATGTETGPDRVLLEVGAARPDSRCHASVQPPVGCEKGAQVELSLTERGD